MWIVYNFEPCEIYGSFPNFNHVCGWEMKSDVISTTCVVGFLISTTCVVGFLISTTCVVGFLISTTCVVGFLISTTCVAKCPRSPLFILLEFDTRVMLHAANAISNG